MLFAAPDMKSQLPIGCPKADITNGEIKAAFRCSRVSRFPFEDSRTGGRSAPSAAASG